MKKIFLIIVLTMLAFYSNAFQTPFSPVTIDGTGLIMNTNTTVTETNTHSFIGPVFHSSATSTNLTVITSLTVNSGATTTIHGTGTINAETSYDSNGNGIFGGVPHTNGYVYSPIAIINTSTGAVYYTLQYPQTLIKTNPTYNLYLIGNGTTNTIYGDGVMINVLVNGTNFWTQY